MTQEMTDGGGVELYIISPLLEAFRETLTASLNVLKNQMCQDDGKPTLRLFAFQAHMVNIVLKHLINDIETDFVRALKDSSEEDYKLFCDVADEIKTTVRDLLADVPFVCNRVDLYNDNEIVKLYIRFEQDEF